jgi:hypothetical protein
MLVKLKLGLKVGLQIQNLVFLFIFTPNSLLQLVWGKLQKSWWLEFKCGKLRLIWIFCSITTTSHNQVVAIAHTSALEELTPSFSCCCNNHIVSVHTFFFWQRLRHLCACKTSEFELNQSNFEASPTLLHL